MHMIRIKVPSPLQNHILKIILDFLVSFYRFCLTHMTQRKVVVAATKTIIAKTIENSSVPPMDVLYVVLGGYFPNSDSSRICDDGQDGSCCIFRV